MIHRAGDGVVALPVVHTGSAQRRIDVGPRVAGPSTPAFSP
jgi:hypothetical protein